MSTGACFTPTTQTDPSYSYVKELSTANKSGLHTPRTDGVTVYSGPISFNDLPLIEISESLINRNQSGADGKLELSNSIPGVMNSCNHERGQSTPRVYGKGSRRAEVRNLTREFDLVSPEEPFTDNESVSWVIPKQASVQSNVHDSECCRYSRAKTDSRTSFPSFYTPGERSEEMPDSAPDSSRHISLTTTPGCSKNSRKYRKAKRFDHSTPIRKSLFTEDNFSSSDIPSWIEPKIQVGLNSGSRLDTDDVSDNDCEVEDRNDSTVKQGFVLGKYTATLFEVAKREKDIRRFKAVKKRNNVERRYFDFDDYCDRIYRLKEHFKRNQ